MTSVDDSTKGVNDCSKLYAVTMQMMVLLIQFFRIPPQLVTQTEFTVRRFGRSNLQQV